MAKIKAHVEAYTPPDEDRTDPVEAAVDANPGVSQVEHQEQLDEEEREFRALRRDFPGVKGAGAAGIVAVSSPRSPARMSSSAPTPNSGRSMPWSISKLAWNGILRCHRSDGGGLECDRYHGDRSHSLLHVTRAGSRNRSGSSSRYNDGEQNEYARTKEIGLMQASDEWVRLFTDRENRCYQVFPAPARRLRRPRSGPTSSQRDLPAGVPR